MVKQGDVVRIKPEYQDAGDSSYVWIAVDDESKGRVTISPVTIDMAIKPTQVVSVSMLCKDDSGESPPQAPNPKRTGFRLRKDGRA